MTALDTLITDGRSYKTFHPEPVAEATLKSLWELTALAPTANNCSPLRAVFVTSDSGLARLADCAHGYNADKVKTAPAAAILALDLAYYTHFPTLAPHLKQPPAQGEWSEAQKREVALQNANIQAGFFILAARHLGLDCGPMGGFDADKIEGEFFDDPEWRFNFVVVLGRGQTETLYPRAARLAFETACRLR